MKEVNPNIILSFSATSFQRLYGAALIGLVPFISFKENFLSCPIVHDEGLIHSLKMHPTFWGKAWVYYVYCFLAMSNAVNVFLFRHLNKRGIFLAYWPASTEIHFKKAYKVAFLIFE